MKYFTAQIFIIYIILNGFQSTAQSWLWANSGGYSQNTRLVTMKKDHAGDFYFATYYDSASVVSYTRLEKKDVSRNHQWNMDFNGNAQIADVEINSQNHPIIAGFYTGTLVIGADTLISPIFPSAFITETDENGNIIWSVSFNPNGDSFKPVDLFIDKNDDLYLTAEISGNHGFCSFHKLNVWGQPVHDEFNDNFEDRTFSHILVDNNGNIFLSGTCGNLATFDTISSASFSYQNFLIKYDSNFNAQWIICRSYVTFDDNNGLASDGHSLYWSFNEATNTGDTIRLVKTDYSGNVQADVAGPLSYAFFPSVSSGTDSSGHTVLVANVFTRIYVYRYDNMLNQEWSDSLFANVSAYPIQLGLLCYDSSFYISSKYFGDSLLFGPVLIHNPNIPAYNTDIFLAEWGWQNSSSVSSIEANSNFKIYPNPTNSNLNIFYFKNSPAKLLLMDDKGTIVLSLNISGNSKQELDLSSVAKGVYFLKIKSNDDSFDEYKKVVIQ